MKVLGNFVTETLVSPVINEAARIFREIYCLSCLDVKVMLIFTEYKLI